MGGRWQTWMWWISAGLVWGAGLVGVYWRLSHQAVPLYIAVSILVLVLTVGLGNNHGGLSAYSVFNPGQERLPGQLTAEQLDDEMRRKDVRKSGMSYEEAPKRRERRPETEDERFQRLLQETRKQVQKDRARRRR